MESRVANRRTTELLAQPIVIRVPQCRVVLVIDVLRQMEANGVLPPHSKLTLQELQLAILDLLYVRGSVLTYQQLVEAFVVYHGTDDVREQLEVVVFDSSTLLVYV